MCDLTAVCDVIFVVMSPADQCRHNTSYERHRCPGMTDLQHKHIYVLKQRWAANGDHWLVNNSKKGCMEVR